MGAVEEVMVERRKEERRMTDSGDHQRLKNQEQ